ncbi:MAG: IS3 family transposase, partial [Actinobacteria bacterium]|nr:IS3 family transposase [Actinomycetota bacterium]
VLGQQLQVSLGCIERLMRACDRQGVHRRRLRGCTRRDQAATPSDDLVERNFRPQGPDRLYVADITQHRTTQGWLYLAVVLDCFSRRVVGWAMADHMRAELVCDAITMAVDNRRPERGLIFHSDRGTQYTSAHYRQLLQANGITQSFSRPRQCWDNAVAEAWFGTLKAELIDRRSWATRAQARRAIFEFIEVFYNRRRLHSSLGYVSPATYEANIHHHKAAAAA